METIKFLEKIASNTHHKINIKQALLLQPENIRHAFNTNQADLIGHHLDTTSTFPDTCTVIKEPKINSLNST